MSSELILTDAGAAEIEAAYQSGKVVNILSVALGSAATRDVQTSKDDVTDGHVLVNGGALALRGTLAGPGRNVESFGDLPQNSVSFGYQDATDSPGFTGSVIDYSGSNGTYRVQLCAQYNSNANRIAFRTHNGDSANEWNGWGEFYHTRNKPTAADVGALPLTGGKLTGNLEISSDTPIIQLSETDTGKKFLLVVDGSGIRLDEDSTAGNNVWTWSGAASTLTVNGQVIPHAYTNFDARYYTQSEANAKFVQGVQLGAEASSVLGNPNPFKAPAGCVMTGWLTEGENPGGDTIYYKPVQRNINGTWVTVSG